MQQYDDLLIDVLLDEGFTLAEAERLVALQKYAERHHGEWDFSLDYQRWVESNFKSKDADHHKH